MRAQTAVEYMAILGIVLAIILPLGAYIWQQNEISIRVQQAEIAADMIAAAADNLWAQGVGAKTTLNVYFPAGYDGMQSSVAGNFVILKVYTPSGYTDIVAVSKANLTGTLPASPGYKQVVLEMTATAVKVG